MKCQSFRATRERGKTKFKQRYRVENGTTNYHSFSNNVMKCQSFRASRGEGKLY